MRHLITRVRLWWAERADSRELTSIYGPRVFYRGVEDNAGPSKTPLMRPTLANILRCWELWRMRSDDPQYAGQRVLNTGDFLRAFLPQRNGHMFVHARPADPSDLRMDDNGRYLRSVPLKAQFGHNLRTTAGLDWESQVLGGGVGSATANLNSLSYRGTATGCGATTLTDSGAAWGTNVWKDHILVANPASGGLVFTRIVSNTGTVITFDRWTDGNTLNTQAVVGTAGVGSAGTTPGTTPQYCILPGAAPALYLCFDTSATTPAAGSTFASITECVTAGVGRTPCQWAHTGGNTFYTMSKNVTNTGGSATGALNNACLITTESGTGTLVFYTALATPPNLAVNDQLQINPWTINH